MVGEAHHLKAFSPILVTLSGIVTEVSELQPQKASFPMLSTLSGMVTEVSEVHCEKASSPIPITGRSRTVEGIVAMVRFGSASVST